MRRHKTEAQDIETSSRSSLKVLQAKVGLSNDQLLTLTSNQCIKYLKVKVNSARKYKNSTRQEFKPSVTKGTVKDSSISIRPKKYWNMRQVAGRPSTGTWSLQHSKMRRVPTREFGNCKNQRITWKPSSTTWIHIWIHCLSSSLLNP